MRTLRKNKQKMFYSLPMGETPIYIRDENGNIMYDGYTDEQGVFYPSHDLNGNPIPLETGNVIEGFSEPIEFHNGISGRLSEVLMEAYGIDDSSIYAQMDYKAKEYPFKEGTLIWKNSKVKYKEQFGETVIDKTSADYEIVGILDEYPNVWSCLLKRLIGNGEESS